MKASLVVVIGLVISGCSSMSSVHSTDQALPQKSHKNPMEVSVYSNDKNLQHPYTILGDATVSKFNTAGHKRQEATIHDAMRSTAASMGGDAIINIKRSDKTVSGTVVAFQPHLAV
jgi:uncharacterized protein YceK